MTWQTAFPNFLAADMPAIPEDWKDVRQVIEESKL